MYGKLMKAILINRSLTRKEEADILDKLSSGNNYDLYSNIDIQNQIAPYTKGKFALTPKEKKKINYDIFDRIIRFGEIKIENKAITELLMIEKASIWHYHKFRTYFYLRNIYFEIALLEKLGKTHKEIFFYTNQKTLANYKLFLPSSVKIKIMPNKTHSSIQNKLSIIYYFLFSFLRIISSLNLSKKIKNKKHIVIDHSMKQTCLNLHTLMPEKVNYYLQYLFEKLNNEFIILEDIELPKFQKGARFKFSLKQLKGNYNKFFGETVMFYGLLSKEVRDQTKKSIEQIKENLKTINEKLQHPLDLLIVHHILSLQKTSNYFLFKYFAYKHFFKKHPFKTISSIDENSPRIKSIFDAAKFNRVKTIGIQHGTIHDLHPAFVFSRKDKDRAIMPDFTIVWGKYWADFLQTTGNYPETSLFITGQVRTDIIPKLLSSKMEIPEISVKDKKTILYASQFQRDLELREKAAYDILKITMNFPEVLLVIKLHPSEINEFDFYHSIAKKVGCNNYKITYWTDLYQLISISDIIITCFSTVGTEAIYFNKPLIIIDYLKQDIQNYHKNRVAFQTSNTSELERTIKQIINKEISINTDAYQSFILKYAFKIDGNVSNRIIQLIKAQN
jgi:CDP-glycerol glycerophosphotransferase (TagB/SpsB family)